MNKLSLSISEKKLMYYTFSYTATSNGRELRQMIIGLEHTIRQQKMEIQHYKQQAQQSDERMTKLQAECTAEREREAAKVEQELKEIEELKEHVNKLEEEKHSMEILLDVYKGVPKEQRDRAQVSIHNLELLMLSAVLLE